MDQLTVSSYLRLIEQLEKSDDLGASIKAALTLLEHRSTDKEIHLASAEDSKKASLLMKATPYEDIWGLSIRKAAQIDKLDASRRSKKLKEKFEQVVFQVMIDSSEIITFTSYNSTGQKVATRNRAIQSVAAEIALRTSFKILLPGYTILRAAKLINTTGRYEIEPSEYQKVDFITNLANQLDSTMRPDLLLSIASHLLLLVKKNSLEETKIVTCLQSLSNTQGTTTIDSPDGLVTDHIGSLVEYLLQPNYTGFGTNTSSDSAAGPAASDTTITEAGLWGGHGNPTATAWACDLHGANLNGANPSRNHSTHPENFEIAP